MIGPNSDSRGFVRIDHACGLALFDEVQKRGDALLDLIAAVQIDIIRAANGIADILLEEVQRFVKFTQQEGFFGGLRESEHDGINMVMSHPDDVISLMNQLGSDHAAAEVGNIDTQLA